MPDLHDISFAFPPKTSLIITGAGSGIGRATAIHAARMGLGVSAWDLDRDGLEETVEQVNRVGAPVHSWIADVSDYSSIREGVVSALEQFGRISLLHNNAGPSSSAPLEFDEALRISVGSMRAMTEAWAKAGPGEGAAMVVTSSVAGNVIGTGSDWYSASKSAVAGYVRHLAAYRSEEFRSNAVAPGMTDTPRLAGFAASNIGERVLQRIPLGRVGTADDIAFATLFLLSPLSAYINGAYLPVDGGWTITQ